MLNSSENECSTFATKKWYVLDSELIESSLCDYSDAYILATGNIIVLGANNNTKGAFKIYAPFRKCRTEINENVIDEAAYINIAMPMYNFIEYSDNYFDTSESLWQFKRDEIEGNVDLTIDGNHTPNNPSSFKLKSSFITNRNGVKKLYQ